MILRFTPFQWGATPSAATVAPVPTPPVWTRVTAVGHWARGVGATLTPRFEHIYAQIPGAAPYRGQNLIHRVQSQYAFRIATGNAVVIASNLSEP